MAIRSSLLLIALPLLSTETIAADPAPDPPEWARSLRIVAFGGPISADVEVSINGEFARVFGAEPTGFQEIGDLLKEGANEMRVALKKPDVARTGSEDLRIEIRSVRERSSRVETTGAPLAEVRIPAAADPESSCEEAIRFRAGPKGAAPEIKNRYWLFVTGPPAKSRVTTRINGAVAYDASEGNQFVEITDLVHKGKNTAEFDVRPACWVAKSGRQGILTFSIGPAKVDEEVVRMTEAPAAEFEISPTVAAETSTAKRSFRAW